MQNGYMLEKCMFEDKNVYYLSLMSKYIRPGDVHVQDSRLEQKLMQLSRDSVNKSQFVLFFAVV